ncbi:MAG: hypothetical protein J3Q66DRAFT_361421 [Benniella sp.]|nr:MAG: hypothetical protein J3Q66DRAFT_361421 [Benniella sp.]
MPSKTELPYPVFSAAMGSKAAKTVFDDMIQSNCTARRQYHEAVFPPMVLSHHHLAEDGPSWNKSTEPDELEKAVGFRPYKSRMETLYRSEDCNPLSPSKESTAGKIDNSWNLSRGEKKEREPGWKLRLLKSRSKRARTVKKRPFEPLVCYNAVMMSSSSSQSSPPTCDDDVTSSESSWPPDADTSGDYSANESQDIDADRVDSSSFPSTSGNSVNAQWLSLLPNSLFDEIRDVNTVPVEKPYNVADLFSDASLLFVSNQSRWGPVRPVYSKNGLHTLW